jgi:transposase
MANWRTLNKRARRKRKRDAQLMRDVDKLIATALAKAGEGLFKQIADDFAKALNQLAVAMRAAVLQSNVEMAKAWGPLDPKYATRRRRIEKWPEVIYEDILDAEYIGEE